MPPKRRKVLNRAGKLVDAPRVKKPTLIDTYVNRTGKIVKKVEGAGLKRKARKKVGRDGKLK